MKKVILIFSLVVFISISAYTQLDLTPSVVASGGSYFEGQSMTISWTIGELATTTLTGNNLVLTQGFQQPTGIGTGMHKDELNRLFLNMGTIS